MMNVVIAVLKKKLKYITTILEFSYKNFNWWTQQSLKFGFIVSTLNNFIINFIPHICIVQKIRMVVTETFLFIKKSYCFFYF